MMLTISRTTAAPPRARATQDFLCLCLLQSSCTRPRPRPRPREDVLQTRRAFPFRSRTFEALERRWEQLWDWKLAWRRGQFWTREQVDICVSQSGAGCFSPS